MPYRARVGRERLRPLAAALLVALAALVLVASADATPKKTKFVSKRYHYSLLLPGGSSSWLNSPATVNWSGSYPTLSNPAFDHLADMRTGGGAWSITAKRVPKGMTLEKWTAYTIAKESPKCTLLPWRSKAKLGGAPARRWDAKCEQGTRWIDLAAVHGHRGYWYICNAGTIKRLATQHACSAVQRLFHYTSG